MADKELKREEEIKQKEAAKEAVREGMMKEDTEAEKTEIEENEKESDEASDAEQPDDSADKGSDKSKKEEKDPKDIKIEELQDVVKRQMAEFDNFRKRTEKEKSAMYEIGAKSIVEKILPVVDNFERGFSGITEDDLQNPFVSGMEKVYKQFISCLEEIGVTPIEAVNTEFNPELHNAVMHIEDEEFGENVIIEEFQKGYRYHDSVIRHSMVKVAN